MDPDELSAGALLFVFGERAARRDAGEGREHSIPRDSGYIHVPSGQRMLAAYLGTLLLSVSVWDLRERGLVELVPTGDLVPEAAKVQITVLRQDPRPSVEGELLTAAAGESAKPVTGSTQGQEGTLLRAVAEIRMPSRRDPWSALCRVWRDEAAEAGFLKLRGLPGRRRPRADPGSLARLDPRFGRLMDGWLGFKLEERDLEAAIRADCFAGIQAHRRPTSS